jgi:hypothetical protein
MQGNAAEPTAGSHDFRLYFDRRDPRQVRIVSLVHAADVWDQVELVDLAPAADPLAASETTATQAAPSPSAARLQLVSQTGEARTGYLLFECLVRALPLFWPAALVTRIPGVADWLRRRYPGTVQMWQAPAPPPGSKGPRIVGAGTSESIQPRSRKRK